jgi:hypothetical protein
MKNIFFLIVITAFIIFSAFGQQSVFLEIKPEITVPVGESTSNFTIGGGAEFSINYPLSFAPWLLVRGGLDYIISPTIKTSPLNLITFAGGPGTRLEITPVFYVHASLMGGYSLGIYNGNTGWSPYAGLEAGFAFQISPDFSLGIRGGYRHNFTSGAALFQGLQFNIGTSFYPGKRNRASNMRIENIQFDNIFPVFYSHYDDHPLGNITIVNDEKGTVKDIEVSFFVPQYMEKPRICFQADELSRNENLSVPLYALFSDRILTVIEGTKISAQLIVEYTYSGDTLKKENSHTLQLYDRNAMIWDDDRKAAAFVTAKDPEVLRFSKNIAGLVRGDPSKAVNLNFRIALALFEALKINGINYVIDPQTPYIDFSADSTAIDYLQFPIQTIDYRAGDCDDLSILYASLLESTGIETAFITVPGHIYTAFNLDMPPAEAKRMFRNPGDLIYVEDTTWLPVEITLVQSGFIEAWEEGAKEWREFIRDNQAVLLPVHNAWNEYKPVGITGISKEIYYPDQDQVLMSFNNVIYKFVEDEISEKVSNYQRQLATNKNPRIMNKLGILYARYGLLGKARIYFEQAARRDYSPALINLGNIQFIEKSYSDSLISFQKAMDLQPGSTRALLGYAKVNYELEDYDTVQTAYEQIERKDPDLAVRFAYLGERRTSSNRASTAMSRELVLWDEEE